MATRLGRIQTFCALDAWANGGVGRSTQGLCGVIDRRARDEVAEATRSYLGGFSSNFEFDDRLFDGNSADPAINDIRRNLWLIYDDIRKHKHRDSWRVTDEQREVIVRAILFLKSDCEYLWPNVPEWYLTFRPIMKLLTLGFGTRALDRKYQFGDTEDLWPFRSQSQLNEAASEPKYLASAT